MQNLTQPTLLLKPFAESGDKNSIPVTNTDAQNPQLADLTNGFPQVTSEDPDDGGLPPERKDFNALGYLTTTYDYFYQAGGTFTFSPTISTAIGGYPLGARLWYTNSNGATTVVRSTVANNTDNFNDGSATGIGTTWVPEIPALGWNNAWTGTNTFSGNAIFAGDVTFSNASGNAIFAGDVTFSNATATEKIAGLGMPDYTSLVTLASGDTAPANGYLYVVGGGNRVFYILIDNVTVYHYNWGVNYGSPDNCYIPVAKGAVVTTTDSSPVSFVPCVGG